MSDDSTSAFCWTHSVVEIGLVYILLLRHNYIRLYHISLLIYNSHYNETKILPRGIDGLGINIYDGEGLTWYRAVKYYTGTSTSTDSCIYYRSPMPCQDDVMMTSSKIYLYVFERHPTSVGEPDQSICLLIRRAKLHIGGVNEQASRTYKSSLIAKIRCLTPFLHDLLDLGYF